MASEVSVVNRALNLLGEPPINSLEEPEASEVAAAQAAGLVLADVRDDVLRGHSWNFAVSRAKPAKLAVAPAFGFSNAFTLPSDFLRVVAVNPPDGVNYRLERVDKQRAIATDADTVNLIYVARVENPNEWDSLFASTMAVRLAAELAVAIKEDMEERDRLFSVYVNEVLPLARTIDAQENPATELIVDDFITARLGRGPFRPIEDAP